MFALRMGISRFTWGVSWTDKSTSDLEDIEDLEGTSRTSSYDNENGI
jgi:hypothetical protein